MPPRRNPRKKRSEPPKPHIARIWTAEDPDRVPAWRYERVKYLLSLPPERQSVMPDDDGPVRLFYQAAQIMGRLYTVPEKVYMLRQRTPGLVEAVTLYQTANPECLALLEGFILSGLSADEIADRFSLRTETIHWYETLCFDVRTRLSCDMFIVQQVLPQHKDYERFNMSADSNYWPNLNLIKAYRTFGYYGGVVALELLAVGFLKSDAKPIHRDTAMTFIRSATMTFIQNAGAVIAQNGRIDSKSEGVLVTLAKDLADKAKEEGKLEVVQNVTRALAAVTPLIGTDVKAEIERKRIDPEQRHAVHLLTSHAEVRAIEQMQAERGMLSVEHLQELANLTFSPSRPSPGEVITVE